MSGSQSRRQAINAVTGYQVPDKDFTEPLESCSAATRSAPRDEVAVAQVGLQSVMSTIDKARRWTRRWPTSSPRR